MRIACVDLTFVLREIHLEGRVQIERLQGDPVLRLELLQETVRPILRLVSEITAHGGAELHQHHDGDGRVGGREIGDLLRLAIVENAEIILLQSRHQIAVVIGDDRVDIYEGRPDRDGDGRRGLGFRRRLSLARGRLRRLGLLGRGRRLGALSSCARAVHALEGTPKATIRTAIKTARNHIFHCIYASPALDAATVRPRGQSCATRLHSSTGRSRESYQQPRR